LGGEFAKLRFLNAPGPLDPRIEDTLLIGAEEVCALAEHAQQVSFETFDALQRWLAQGQVLAGSAAALLLMQLLGVVPHTGVVQAAIALIKTDQSDQLMLCFSCYRKVAQSKQQLAGGSRN
jgi:hypothetical protein